MKKKAVRTIAYVMLGAVLAFSLTGCNIVPSLNLTEEQSSLIAEYAAGKLIEYVKGHPGGLMKVEDVDLTEVNPGLKKPKEEPAETPLLPGDLPGTPEAAPPEEGPMPEEGEGMPAPDEAGQEALVDAPAEVASVPTMTIAEALGINGASVDYGYYEVAPTYPENAQELAFSMKAAKGKELLVVHFDLSNQTDSDIEAHTDSTNFKVRMMLNGGEKLRGDVTFLDNDLMNYQGLLTAGSKVDAVLVFEIPESEEVSSMDLLIVTDDGEQTYKLM